MRGFHACYLCTALECEQSSRQSPLLGDQRTGIDDAGAMRLARDPEFVWGCDSGACRSGFWLHQSFEAVRRRSRTSDQIRLRVCTKHRHRSSTVRRSVGRRAMLIQVCHRPIAGQSNRASPGNPPPTTAKNLYCCTGHRHYWVVIWRFKLYHPLALQTIPFYLLVS